MIIFSAVTRVFAFGIRRRSGVCVKTSMTQMLAVAYPSLLFFSTAPQSPHLHTVIYCNAFDRLNADKFGGRIFWGALAGANLRMLQFSNVSQLHHRPSADSSHCLSDSSESSLGLLTCRLAA